MIFLAYWSQKQPGLVYEPVYHKRLSSENSSDISILEVVAVVWILVEILEGVGNNLSKKTVVDWKIVSWGWIFWEAHCSLSMRFQVFKKKYV